MSQRQGTFTPNGPLTLGDLREMIRGADRLNYPDDAAVDVKTPMTGDRRRVTFTVTDGYQESLGEPPDVAPPPDEPQEGDETEWPK